MISLSVHSPADKLGDYQDKLVELIRADAALNQTIPKSIRSSTEGLLRLVNCYYSNKIEGNSTHPKDFLKAQSENQNPADNTSKDILELLAHLEAQIKLSLCDIKPSTICEPEFIKSIHKSFYDLLPVEFLVIKDKNGNNVVQEDGEPLLLRPGHWREKDVVVGKHLPPSYEEINRYMTWISSSYRLDRIHGTNKVLAAAAFHHRLAWIHPFQDGNGRAIRLLTDCYMKAAGLGGYGLWSITRGFGRDTDAYYTALSAADTPRQGDYDGRGILSEKGLIIYTKYFIDTALDQVNYFTSLLEPRNLGIRIDVFFEIRSRDEILGIDGKRMPVLNILARDIYKILLERGSMSRQAIRNHLNKGEQTLRPIFKQMNNEGLINAEPRQDVEIKLSPQSIEILFPHLFGY